MSSTSTGSSERFPPSRPPATPLIATAWSNTASCGCSSRHPEIKAGKATTSETQRRAIVVVCAMRVFPLLALVAVGALAGCTKSTELQPTPSRAPTIHHPDPEGAVRRCVAGIEPASVDDPASALPKMIAACAKLYAESSCRSAWARIGTASPTERIGRVADAVDICRRTYCPILPAPKPGLCDGKTSNASEQRAELLVAILTYDLGPTHTATLAQKLSQAAEVLRSSALAPIVVEARAPCDAELVLDVRDRGVWVGSSTGVRRFVAKCGQALDRAALAEELCGAAQAPELACTEVVNVAAHGTVPYADVVAVMDLARAAGFLEVGFTSVESLPLSMPVAATAGQTAPPRCGAAPSECPPKPR